MPSFEITEVEPEARTWTAKKGPAAGQEFKSYTVRAKGPNGHERTYEISRKPTSPPPSLGVVEADVQPSSGDFPDKLKLSFSGRQNGFGGSQAKDDYWQKKEQRDIESQARMGRAHAQEMALRWWAVQNGTKGVDFGTRDARDDWFEKVLLPVIDWFHADVQRFPVEADGGGDGSLSTQSPTTAAVGFASEKQKGFFERRLKDGGLDSNQVEGVKRFAETLPKDRVKKAIDALKDDSDKAIGALLVESDKWARTQTTLPYDETA